MTKAVKGFLIAPFVPCIVFVFVAAGFGIISVLFTRKWSDLLAAPLVLVGSFYWLFFALPVSYFFSLLFGIPMYLIFKKVNLVSLKAYLIGSSVAGTLSGLFPVLYFTSDSSWALFWIIGGCIFGAIAGYSFWTIVYGSPNNIFDRFLKRWQEEFPRY